MCVCAPERPQRSLTSDQTHLPALDGLRGIAILAVVAFHVAVVATSAAPWAHRSSPPWYAWPAFAGSLGVDVFFVLSGFLVLRSWRSIRRRNPNDFGRSLADFARRRSSRLLPPYWVALLILVPWRAPHWLSSPEGITNIAMFASINQFIDPSLPGRLNTVTWSLTTETHFYLLLPILAFVGVRYGWGRLLACLLVLTVGWRIAVGGTGAEAEWILGRADQFAAGMTACALADGERAKPSALLLFLCGPSAGWLLGGTLTAVALTHGALRLVPKPLAFLSLLHAVTGLAVAGIIVRIVCTGSGSRFLRSRALAWLGLISYSLYLWHWPILAESADRWGSSALVLVAAATAGIAVAVVSYLLVERPFSRTRSATGSDDRELAGSNGLGRRSGVAREQHVGLRESG